MPLPTVVHSQVDPAAITKVTRLFNNTLGSILTELIQNARRAGATRARARARVSAPARAPRAGPRAASECGPLKSTHAAAHVRASGQQM